MYIGGSPCATATHAFLFTCFRLCMVYLPSSSVTHSHSFFLLLFSSPFSPSAFTNSAVTATTPEVCCRRPAFVFVFNFSALYCYTRIIIYIAYCHVRCMRSRKTWRKGCDEGRNLHCTRTLSTSSNDETFDVERIVFGLTLARASLIGVARSNFDQAN